MGIEPSVLLHAHPRGILGQKFKIPVCFGYYKIISMDDERDGVEMQVRNVRTDASNTSMDDTSPGAEAEDDQKHHSAAVRRLLGDESFHAPRQEGTVRTSVFESEYQIM
jgi:hypothetical protein